MSETPKTDSLRKRFAGKKVSNTECAELYDHASELERKLAEVKKQRDDLAKSFELVWKHLKGERIRHDYIFGAGKSGERKTLQKVCEEALDAVKGGEG